MVEDAEDPIDETDKILTRLSKRGNRAVRALLATLVLIVMGLSAVVGYLVNSSADTQAQLQSNQIQASSDKNLCDYFGLRASVPVTQATTKVSLGLLIDSRVAYAGLGCTPVLPLPSSQLNSLAKKYDITL